MAITLIICITIVLIATFICSVYVNIKRQQINKEKDLEEYKLNNIYTKDSAVCDMFMIQKLVNKLDDTCIIGELNKNNIELIKEILKPYTEEEIN